MSVLINSFVRNGDVFIRNNDLIKSLLEDKKNYPKDISVDEFIDETIHMLLKYEASILKQYNENKGRY